MEIQEAVETQVRVAVELTLGKRFFDEYPQTWGVAKIAREQYTEEDGLLVESKEVGEIAFTIFNLRHYAGDVDNLLEPADASSGEDLELMYTFIKYLKKEDLYDYLDWNSSILVLERMRIAPDYRKQQIGTQALEQFMDYCKDLNVSFCVLKPAPTEPLNEGETRKKKIKKLKKFYKKAGFVAYKPKKDEPIMVADFTNIREMFLKPMTY